MFFNAFKAHHVAISVSNIKKSTEFYANFGFKNVKFWRSERNDLTIVHMKLKDFILELFSYAEYKPLPDVAKEIGTDLPELGVKHFALQIDSLEKARDFFLKMNLATNIEIKEGRTGIKYFFVRDPDGILVEFVEDTRALEDTEAQHLAIQSKL